jgi:hypothetical protein
MGGGNAAQAGPVVKAAPAASSDKHDATIAAFFTAGTTVTLCCALALDYRENT